MTPLVKIGKVFRPSRFDTRALQNRLRNAVRREAREVISLMESTTSNWHGDKPTFKASTSVKTKGAKAGDISVVVVPTGSKDAVDKWWRLNDGTSVRYAKMQKGYRRKTSPNRLATRPGSKGRPYVNKKNKLPGIKPRNWTKIIANKRSPVFRRELTKIIRGVPRKGAKP